MKALIEKLRANPAVTVITKHDPAYNDSRLVYNRMHDCYPELIVRTLDVSALRSVLKFAQKSGTKLVIRGGGHHIGGFSTCDGGIVIDFSPFRGVAVDEHAKVAYVQPGARLGDFDETLFRYGLVAPTGTVSDTGIAGLTLGGGIGWLVGSHGLTCDHLYGADVLLADGNIVKAEAPECKDLLWALRGGGGNFGIVLQFRYRLNNLPRTTCGSGFVAWNKVPEVLPVLVDYLARECPESISVAPVFFKDLSDVKFLRIDFCHSGTDPKEIDALLKISQEVEWRNVRQWVFKEWQRTFDQAFLPPMRGYWKACYTDNLTPDIQKRLINSLEESPNRSCSILIEHLHGAFKRVDQEESAFHLRNANFGILFSARWPDACADKSNIEWARRSFLAVDPQENSQTYLNYTSSDDDRGTRGLIGGTRSRIVEVKTKYDPKNLFRANHNILPNREAR